MGGRQKTTLFIDTSKKEKEELREGKVRYKKTKGKKR